MGCKSEPEAGGSGDRKRVGVRLALYRTSRGPTPPWRSEASFGPEKKKREPNLQATALQSQVSNR